MVDLKWMGSNALRVAEGVDDDGRLRRMLSGGWVPSRLFGIIQRRVP